MALSLDSDDFSGLTRTTINHLVDLDQLELIKTYVVTRIKQVKKDPVKSAKLGLPDARTQIK